MPFIQVIKWTGTRLTVGELSEFIKRVETTGQYKTSDTVYVRVNRLVSNDGERIELEVGNF